MRRGAGEVALDASGLPAKERVDSPAHPYHELKCISLENIFFWLYCPTIYKLYKGPHILRIKLHTEGDDGMNKNELMTELEIILEESKTAILSTADKEGNPHARWMTPTILKDRQNVIYAVTSAEFDKAGQIEANQNVEWMVQTPSLDSIITLRGKINLLDNASIKSEVLESIGKRLTAFWKLNEKQANLLVLETIIQEAVLFKPMIGSKTKIKFL